MSLLDAFTSIRKTAADAENEYRSIRRRREELRRERDALRARPAVRVDLKAMLGAWVSERRDAYFEHLEATLRPFVSNPERMRDSGNPQRFPFTVAGLVAPPAGPFEAVADTVSVADVDRLLCALFPEQVEAVMASAIDQMPMPEGGLSLADRDKKIRKLEGQIADLDAQMEQIQLAAQQAGVVLNLHHIEDL